MVYVCFVDAVDWQAFITGQCDDGRSSVRLCGLQNGRRFCVNDLLVCNEYAAAVGDIQIGMFLPTLICNIFLFFFICFRSHDSMHSMLYEVNKAPSVCLLHMLSKMAKHPRSVNYCTFW